MSMMECSCCLEACDSRSMSLCPGCGKPLCPRCAREEEGLCSDCAAYPPATAKGLWDAAPLFPSGIES